MTAGQLYWLFFVSYLYLTRVLFTQGGKILLHEQICQPPLHQLVPGHHRDRLPLQDRQHRRRHSHPAGSSPVKQQWNTITQKSDHKSPPFACVCVRSGTRQAQRGSSLWVPLSTEEPTAACWCLMSHQRPVLMPWSSGGRSSSFRESPRIHLTSLLSYWATKLTCATGRSVKACIRAGLWFMSHNLIHSSCAMLD